MSDQPDKFQSDQDVASSSTAKTADSAVIDGYGALEVCAREPIHIPGAIQPHGMLLAVDVAAGTVRYVSANSDAFVGYTPERLLEQPLASLLAPTSYDKVMVLLDELHDRRVRIDQPEKRTTTLEIRVFEPEHDRERFTSFDVTLHLSHTLSANTPASMHSPTWRGGLHDEADTDTRLVNPERTMLMLEVEPLSQATVSFNEVQRSLDYLRSARDVPQLLEMTTETVATLFGYDRVMAYQFAADGHGEIVAEVLQQPASDGSTLESYLHLHYPASDIPEQARRLYLLNHVRTISSNNYTPVPLLSTPDAPSPTNEQHETHVHHEQDAQQSDVAQSDATKPDAKQYDVTQSDATQPDVTQSDVTKPDAKQYDVTQSDVAKPDAKQSDVTQSDVAKPDAKQSDVEPSEDTPATPAKVIADRSPQAARALDLSLTGLRSVSPFHLEYMRNMGTAASLVSSLVVDGNLWGMIVCHHSTPRTADVHLCGLMDFLSDLVSLLIAERNYTAAYQTRLVHQQQLREFTQHLLQSSNLDTTAQDHAAVLLELTHAHGVAFCLTDNAIHQHGNTPPLTVIKALHEHWQQHAQEHLPSSPTSTTQSDSNNYKNIENKTKYNDYHALRYSHSLHTDFADLDVIREDIVREDIVRENAAGHNSEGVLYVPINDTAVSAGTTALPQHFVMWFRDELVKTVHWGGDPNKAVQAGQRVSPRRSFAAWQETVRGQAEPWQEHDLSIALELRHTIGAALLKRAEHQLSELRQRNEQVRESNMAKSEFLSRVSHELRTPLNAILGFAQVLSMRQLNDSQSRGVSRILEAGKHLLNLVDEVLDISRVDAGHLHLSLEAVPLWEIIMTCIDIMQPLAANRRVTLECHSHDRDNPHVSADRQRLKQIVINLLANAIKYNRDDGTVTVHFETHQANQVLVRVTDTGMGIAEDKMHRLFSPFDRLDIETDSNIEGTGLGLTLTKSLVEAMNGNIGAESVVGKGTTFWFTLPLARVSQSRKPVAISPTPSSASKRKLLVLYIEDNASDVEFVQYQLADYRDVQLLSSPRADKGATLALQYQPDVIVVDQFLPDMDSDALIRQLREHKTMQQVTIVGLASPGEDASALQASANFVLLKPLELPVLLSQLQDRND